jgi:putative transposase
MGILSTKHAVFSLEYDLAWCTKFRHPVLVDSVEIELRHVLSECCVASGWKIVSIEIMPDHAHLLLSAPPSVSPAEIVHLLKSVSAVHLFLKFPKMKARRFWGSGLWSRSSFYATVGAVSESAVKRYIETQKQTENRRPHSFSTKKVEYSAGKSDKLIGKQRFGR